MVYNYLINFKYLGGVCLKKKYKHLMGSILIFILLFSLVSATEAATVSKVKWGKIEVTKTVIGKVQVIKDTTLYKLEKNKLKSYKTVKKGTESAVFSVNNQFGTIYNIGSNFYYKKSSSIKYLSVPKDISEKLNPTVPQVSYLDPIFPSMKFGITKNDVEKILKQKPSLQSGAIFIYDLNITPQIKKIFAGYEGELQGQFTFEKEKLVKVYLNHEIPYLKTDSAMQKELDKYVSTTLKPFKTPIKYEKYSSKDYKEMDAYIQNKNEALYIMVDSSSQDNISKIGIYYILSK
jgi:hypothetical protein